MMRKVDKKLSVLYFSWIIVNQLMRNGRDASRHYPFHL